MSNKRIRKKQAKTEMLRDKSKIIANMIVMFDYNKPRYEQLKTARMLWKMSLEELIHISDEAIRAWIALHSPLRPMIPRNVPCVDWSSVVGYRPTISDVRERT